MSDMIREILYTTAYRKMDMDELLDMSKPSWIRFDPELGYVPADIVMKDGMDGARSTYTHGPGGARKMVNYGDKPCRINTYGDSFTQSQQVSDDESWQERLAAHIGEPIRNFGMGGYGLNQAYLRAMRYEDTELGAEYIIFNVFDDDHVRSLDLARWPRTAWWQRDFPKEKAWPMHGLPWAHVRYDLEKGWVDIPGYCKNEDELRALTDKERFYNLFKDDPIIRLFAMQQGGETEVADLEAVAEALGIKVDLRDPAKRREDAQTLHRMYGFKATEYIFGKLMPWLAERNKNLMVITSYSIGALKNYIEGKGRADQPFVDFLKQNNVCFVDPLEKHAEDFRKFKISLDDYVFRYYIKAAGSAVFGHYNPLGNHFYAFSIKNEVVEWLDPKPPAYK